MEHGPSPQFNADRLVEASSKYELVIASTPTFCPSTPARSTNIPTLGCTSKHTLENHDLHSDERTLQFYPEDVYGNNFAEFNGGTEDYRSSILMNRNAAGIEEIYDQQRTQETLGHGLNHQPKNAQLPTFVPGSENHNHIFPAYKDDQQVEQSSTVLKWKACANVGISKSKESPGAKDAGNLKRVGLLTRGMGMLNFHMMQFTAHTFSGLAADVSCCAETLKNEFSCNSLTRLIEAIYSEVV